MATSYSNPGGSEDRRDGRIWAYIEGTASSWNGNPIGLLSDHARNENYSSNIPGVVRLVFDFFAPRVVDELSVTLSASANMGSWAFEASSDGVTWTTLTAASPMTGSRAFSAPGNTTAYRYYSLYKASGNPSNGPWWQQVRFKIDDNVSLGTWPAIAKGDRRSIITVTTSPLLTAGGSFSETIIGGRSVAGATYGPGYFQNGKTDGIITFQLNAGAVIQGAVFYQESSYASQGFWKWQGSNDGVAWTDLSSPIEWDPKLRGIVGAGTSAAAMTLGWFSTFNPTGTSYSRYRLVQTSGATSNVPYLCSMVFIVGSGGVPSSIVYPTGGSLRVTGFAPSIVADIYVNPGAGSLLVSGKTPQVGTQTILSPSAGSLILNGYPPHILSGVSVSAGPDTLIVSGNQPLIYTESGVVSSQVATLAVVGVYPDAMASQLAVMAVAEPPPPPSRVSQAAALAVAEVVPELAVSQVAALVLVDASRCVTGTCQTWTIRRRDGKIFRYTSLDRDLVYGGKIYKACGSLDPSAAQNGATLGDTGSISLSGLITDNGISESELFGGLFDDAFVTIDLIHWDDPTVTPKRLASGWVGKVSQRPAFHTMEVLSVGARLEQAALVQVVSPSCRWQFGDARCGVNVEAMKIHGQIRRVINRADLLLDLSPPPDDGRIWKSGRMRFVDGVCAGMVCEYKGVDFASGQITLWAPAGLVPSPGDAVEILPGCDLNRDGGCKAYNNIINFGGFPDVPGTDAILETPDAKI